MVYCRRLPMNGDAKNPSVTRLGARRSQIETAPASEAS